MVPERSNKKENVSMIGRWLKKICIRHSKLVGLFFVLFF